MMPFGSKNELAAFQKVVTKSFKEYLDNFMKIFLDDFIVIVTWKLICKSSYYAFKSARNTTLI
jgi:hypothetical protein